MDNSLANRGIVVTRPREQAGGLARLIEAAGGRAWLFPAIAIEPLPAPPALGRLSEFDLVIFISPSAVQHAGALPPGLRTAAVGAGTRRELERRGMTRVTAPTKGADSEALLEVLKDVAGKRIGIVRGEGGRALLGDALTERGARVEYAECYRRVKPAAARPAWKAGEVAAVTVSSAEGLANLFEMLDPGFLRATPLFVPHQRVADAARARAAREVVVAGPADEEVVACLVKYFHP